MLKDFLPNRVKKINNTNFKRNAVHMISEKRHHLFYLHSGKQSAFIFALADNKFISFSIM